MSTGVSRWCVKVGWGIKYTWTWPGLSSPPLAPWTLPYISMGVKILSCKPEERHDDTWILKRKRRSYLSDRSEGEKAGAMTIKVIKYCR